MVTCLVVHLDVVSTQDAFTLRFFERILQVPERLEEIRIVSNEEFSLTAD